MLWYNVSYLCRLFLTSSFDFAKYHKFTRHYHNNNKKLSNFWTSMLPCIENNNNTNIYDGLLCPCTSMVSTVSADRQCKTLCTCCCTFPSSSFPSKLISSSVASERSKRQHLPTMPAASFVFSLLTLTLFIFALGCCNAEARRSNKASKLFKTQDNSTDSNSNKLRAKQGKCNKLLAKI